MPKTIFYPHVPVAAQWFNILNGVRLDFSGTDANNLRDGQYLRLRADDFDWLGDSRLSSISRRTNSFLVYQSQENLDSLKVEVLGGILKTSPTDYLVIPPTSILLIANKTLEVILDATGKFEAKDSLPKDLPHIHLATVVTGTNTIGSIFDRRPDQTLSTGVSGAGDDGFEVGDVKWTARVNISDNWLVADGRFLSPTDYPELFNAIGYQYGKEQNGNKFKLPDARGRTLRSGDLGFMGGRDSLTLSIAQMPSHTHQLTLNDQGHSHTAISNLNPTPHSHTAWVNDQGHTHPHFVSEPSSMGYEMEETGRPDGARLLYYKTTTDIQTTGVTVDINAASAGGVINTSVVTNTSSINGSVQSTGRGDSIDITNPFLSLRLLIKARSLKSQTPPVIVDPTKPSISLRLGESYSISTITDTYEYREIILDADKAFSSNTVVDLQYSGDAVKGTDYSAPDTIIFESNQTTKTLRIDEP